MCTTILEVRSRSGSRALEACMAGCNSQDLDKTVAAWATGSVDAQNER